MGGFERDPIPEAYEYLKTASQEFPPEVLGEVQTAGGRLVRAAGGFRLDAHEIQEINMRKCDAIRENIGRQKHLFPAVADQLAEFFRIGACPTFAAMREHIGRGYGYPRDDTKTMQIIISIWPDIMKGRVFVTGASMVPYSERVEATPTASAPKKGPDLLPSGKTERFRTCVEST